MLHWDGDGPAYKPSCKPNCVHCLLSKVTSQPVSKNSFKFVDTSTPLAHVWADTSVAMGVSKEGYEHYTIVFPPSSATPFVYFLKNKSESHEWLMHWLRLAHNYNQQTPFRVLHLHLDHGELYTKDIREYCSKRGIEVHVNARSAHEHNSKAERPIRTVNEMARSICSFGGADYVDYWPIGVACAEQVLGVLPPTRRMYPKTKDGPKRSRPLQQTRSGTWT